MHTITLLKNLSSNPVERFHRTFSAVLRTRGPGVRPNWDVWLNAKVFTFNTTVYSSTGVQQYRSYTQLRHVWVQCNTTCGLGISYCGFGIS